MLTTGILFLTHILLAILDRSSMNFIYLNFASETIFNCCKNAAIYARDMSFLTKCLTINRLLVLYTTPEHCVV